MDRIKYQWELLPKPFNSAITILHSRIFLWVQKALQSNIFFLFHLFIFSLKDYPFIYLNKLSAKDWYIKNSNDKRHINLRIIGSVKSVGWSVGGLVCRSVELVCHNFLREHLSINFFIKTKSYFPNKNYCI